MTHPASSLSLYCVGDITYPVSNLILDSVIKKVNLRGDVILKLKQIVVYADDVALLARSLKAVQEYFMNYKVKQHLLTYSMVQNPS